LLRAIVERQYKSKKWFCHDVLLTSQVAELVFQATGAVFTVPKRERAIRGESGGSRRGKGEEES